MHMAFASAFIYLWTARAVLLLMSPCFPWCRRMDEYLELARKLQEEPKNKKNKMRKTGTMPNGKQKRKQKKKQKKKKQQGEAEDSDDDEKDGDDVGEAGAEKTDEGQDEGADHAAEAVSDSKGADVEGGLHGGKRELYNGDPEGASADGGSGIGHAAMSWFDTIESFGEVQCGVGVGDVVSGILIFLGRLFAACSSIAIIWRSVFSVNVELPNLSLPEVRVNLGFWSWMHDVAEGFAGWHLFDFGIINQQCLGLRLLLFVMLECVVLLVSALCLSKLLLLPALRVGCARGHPATIAVQANTGAHVGKGRFVEHAPHLTLNPPRSPSRRSALLPRPPGTRCDRRQLAAIMFGNHTITWLGVKVRAAAKLFPGIPGAKLVINALPMLGLIMLQNMFVALSTQVVFVLNFPFVDQCGVSGFLKFWALCGIMIASVFLNWLAYWVTAGGMNDWKGALMRMFNIDVDKGGIPQRATKIFDTMCHSFIGVCTLWFLMGCHAGLNAVCLVVGVWPKHLAEYMSIGKMATAYDPNPRDKRNAHADVIKYEARSVGLLWFMLPGTGIVGKFMEYANASPVWVSPESDIKLDGHIKMRRAKWVNNMLLVISATGVAFTASAAWMWFVALLCGSLSIIDVREEIRGRAKQVLGDVAESAAGVVDDTLGTTVNPLQVAIGRNQGASAASTTPAPASA